MIEDLLAPLAPREPTDAEIARLLARADARRRRRRIRVATGAALATAAATALFAALPSDDEAPLTAGSLLQTTAAVAADQPGPPAWTGFRYIQQVWRTEHGGATIERTEEQWTDSRWQGRRDLTRGEGRRRRAAARGAPCPTAGRRAAGDRPAPGAALRQGPRGDPSPVRARGPEVPARRARRSRPRATCPTSTATPRWPRSRSSELPTDPKALATLLLEAHEDGRWTLHGGWNPLPVRRSSTTCSGTSSRC